MKVVVIGGTGLIGSKLVNQLKQLDHEVVAASPSKGVNALTGEGLKEALKNAQVVVDVANSPSFEDKAVLKFFEDSSRNLLAAEKEAGVKHHVALSIVNTDQFPENGYFRAKMAQENLIKSSPIPYTIVRATQFLEFLGGIAQTNTVGNTIRLPTAFIQPIAADDVAAALLKVVLEKPVNGFIEIAGPERFPLFELVERYLKTLHDPRQVIPDPQALYYGSLLKEDTLIPHGNKAQLGPTNFKIWVENQAKVPSGK